MRRVVRWRCRPLLLPACCLTCHDGRLVACAAGYHERPQQWPRAGPVDAPVEHGVTAVVDGEPMHPSGVAAAESSTYAMCRRPAGAPLWRENHERIRLVIQ